jgi:DnaJ-like protein
MLTIEDSTLVINVPYNAGLVAAIKSLPVAERKWEPTRKVWLVDPRHAATVAGLIQRYTGRPCVLPTVNVQARIEQRILEVHYIGTCKNRTIGDTATAFGWMNESWCVIFPESVLREWFGIQATPTEASTLYSVVGVASGASADEVKAAYRRLARQWHPDVSREPNSKEQFLAIKHAYDVLSDTRMRAKYDAGLKLQASLNGKSDHDKYAYPFGKSAQSYQADYRSPLRCGLLIATGQDKLGRFLVSKIHAWEDIRNSQGLTLVASWPMGANEPVEQWV